MLLRAQLCAAMHSYVLHCTALLPQTSFNDAFSLVLGLRDTWPLYEPCFHMHL